MTEQIIVDSSMWTGRTGRFKFFFGFRFSMIRWWFRNLKRLPCPMFLITHGYLPEMDTFGWEWNIFFWPRASRKRGEILSVFHGYKVTDLNSDFYMAKFALEDTNEEGSSAS